MLSGLSKKVNLQFQLSFRSSENGNDGGVIGVEAHGRALRSRQIHGKDVEQVR